MAALDGDRKPLLRKRLTGFLSWETVLLDRRTVVAPAPNRDQKGGPAMSTTSEPIDDSYPEAWKPQYVKEREQQRTEFELHVSALSDEELQRIRGDR